MAKVRKKTWDEKVKLTRQSFERASKSSLFAREFYDNLFFLKPKIKEYFQETDFKHQEKALMRGLEYFFGFFKNDKNARGQLLRIARTHSKQNLNIHPHDYYYWIEALIMTGKKLDNDWFDDLEYYWREVMSFPVFFIISQYYREEF